MKAISPARAMWKIVYRLQRITRREVAKARMDAVLFGRGAYEIDFGVPGYIQHIPADRIAA